MNLYQEQQEIDTWPNYELLLKAIFQKKPKQIHTGRCATREGRNAYMRDWWHKTGKFRRRKSRT